MLDTQTQVWTCFYFLVVGDGILKNTESQKYNSLVSVLISRSVTFHGRGRMGILCLSEAVLLYSNLLGEMTWLRKRGRVFLLKSFFFLFIYSFRFPFFYRIPLCNFFSIYYFFFFHFLFFVYFFWVYLFFMLFFFLFVCLRKIRTNDKERF